MKLLSSCAFFGAVRALGGIRDAVVLQHSVVGCQWGTLVLRYGGRPYEVRQASSVIYEQDVLLGGHHQLEATLRQAAELFPDKSAFLVVSGCVPQMIGDDVEGVISQVGLECPVLHIKAPGYGGNADSGIEAAYLALLPLVEEQGPAQGCGSRPPVINLFGILNDDPLAENDLQALQELLGGRVEINCCLADCSLEEIAAMGRADLNVVLGYGEGLAAALAERCGTPFARAEYPYGVSGARRLLQLLAERLGVDFAPELEALEAQARRLVYRSADYLANLYDLPAAVVADKTHLRGMAAFLEEELGMEVVLQEDTAELDQAALEQAVLREKPALLCGSSLLQPLAEKYQLPLLRCAYPLLDEVHLAPATFVGSRGAACLVERLVNGALQQRYRAEGLYSPLRQASCPRGEQP